MDELKTLWGEIQSDQEFELLTSQKISNSIRTRSKSVLAKMATKVFFRTWFCVGVVVLLVAAIPFVALAHIQILLTVLLMAYLSGGILLFGEYQRLKEAVALDQNIYGALKMHQKRLKSILHLEEIVSLLLYPISATAGFFVGMYLYNPNTELLNEPKDWFLLLIPMIAFTPIAHLITKRWNRHSFGAHLSELQRNIQELEEGV